MLEIAVISGVVAFVYTDVLMNENNILFWWWKLINKYLSGWKLYLLTCSMCMAGQIALWSSICMGYSFIEVIIIVSSAILTAKILTRWS